MTYSVTDLCKDYLEEMRNEHQKEIERQRRLSLTDALIVIAALGFVIACVCWGLSNWADSLPPTKEELAHIRLMNERGIGR